MKDYSDVIRVYRWSLSQPLKQLCYGFRGISFEKQPLSKDEPVFTPRKEISLPPLLDERNWMIGFAVVYVGIAGTLTHYIGDIVGAPFRLRNRLSGKI